MKMVSSVNVIVLGASVLPLLMGLKAEATMNRGAMRANPGCDGTSRTVPDSPVRLAGTHGFRTPRAGVIAAGADATPDPADSVVTLQSCVFPQHCRECLQRASARCSECETPFCSVECHDGGRGCCKGREMSKGELCCVAIGVALLIVAICVAVGVAVGVSPHHSWLDGLGAGFMALACICLVLMCISFVIRSCGKVKIKICSF